MARPVIEGLFHERRMFGGAVPRAWPEAAVAMRYLDRYEDDYAASWRAADALIELLAGKFSVRRIAAGTSRFYLKPEATADAGFVDRVLAHGVALAPLNPATGEIVMEVNPSILRKPPDAIARVLIESMDG